LPPGTNRVEFEYSPTLFGALTALNRITIVLLLVFVIFAVIRKARDTKRADAEFPDAQVHSGFQDGP